MGFCGVLWGFVGFCGVGRKRLCELVAVDIVAARGRRSPFGHEFKRKKKSEAK